MRTLVEVHDHGGDVVRPALLARLEDEPLRRRLRVAARERDLHRVGGHRAAQPVAAEQQHVAGQELLRELVDARPGLSAQGAAEDAAVGVDGRLFEGQAAVAHHLAHERVVVAHLAQLAVAEQVGAAVADVREPRRVAVEHERGERGAHARLVDVVVGTLEHRRVGRLCGVEQRGALGDLRGQRLGGQAAGHLAGVGAAHAVADGVQRRLDDVRVLVGLAVEPDVAEGAVSRDERHGALTPRSGTWSRRCAAGCPS